MNERIGVNLPFTLIPKDLRRKKNLFFRILYTHIPVEPPQLFVLKINSRITLNKGLGSENRIELLHMQSPREIPVWLLGVLIHQPFGSIDTIPRHTRIRNKSHDIECTQRRNFRGIFESLHHFVLRPRTRTPQQRKSDKRYHPQTRDTDKPPIGIFFFCHSR